MRKPSPRMNLRRRRLRSMIKVTLPFAVALCVCVLLGESVGAQPTAAQPAAAQPSPEPPSETEAVASPQGEGLNEQKVVEEPPAELPEQLAPIRYLRLPRVGDYRRAVLHVDPVEATLAQGSWAPPEAGDPVFTAGGEQRAWRDEGEIDLPPGELAGGYAFGRFRSPAAGVMLLEAPGSAAVCLNGDWVAGDPYQVGWFRPPVEVRRGENELLLHLADPAARVKLVAPPAPVSWITQRATLPDAIDGDPTPLVVSIPLVNATTEPVEGATLSVSFGSESPLIRALRRIDPLLVTPITVRLPPTPADASPGETIPLRIELVRPAADGEPSPAPVVAELSIRVVARSQPHRRTFLSAIDGSVQPYAVRPAAELPAAGSEAPLPVLLALHDAGETPDRCADLYGRLDGLHVVAPGGRGEWGFDWEDWSARDALESLADFQRRGAATGVVGKKSRVSVTGRGMGGHGALWLGVLMPDRFAAVAPHNGWISLYTQGGSAEVASAETPLAEVLRRQSAARDPLRVLANLSGTGVYLLNDGGRGPGVVESRMLRRRLGEFHNDFSYYESPPSARGGEPVRWAPLVEFAKQRISAAGTTGAAWPDRIDFATPDLGAASSRGWVAIDRIARPGAAARATVRRNRQSGTIVGTTDNVRRLSLSLEGIHAVSEQSDTKPIVEIRLDGERAVRWTQERADDVARLRRDASGRWKAAPDRGGSPGFTWGKSPRRPGGFKSAFDHRPLLVYGTRGDEQERRWAAAKARYDAHLFLYRGAGRLEVTPDTQYRPGSSRARSIILYGNQETNRAAGVLMSRRPIAARSGRVEVGPRPEEGDDLALLAVLPRRTSPEASLALIGGAGPVGMRATTRLRYFWSGIAPPDLLLFGPAAIYPAEGQRPESDVRAAGYFDDDWGVEDGEILWRDLAI